MIIVDTVLFEIGMASRPSSSVSVSSKGSLPHKFRSILASDLVGVWILKFGTQPEIKSALYMSKIPA
jgi:hypothetical protein